MAVGVLQYVTVERRHHWCHDGWFFDFAPRKNFCQRPCKYL